MTSNEEFDWDEIDWGYAENVALHCPDCGVTFTAEADIHEFVPGTCQQCGANLESEVR